MSDELTVAFLAWRKKRRNHRIVFGHPSRNVRLDWQRSLAVFKAGEIFAYERWTAKKYGTQNWSIYVLQAQKRGCEITKVPGVKPGAKILAETRGKTACLGLLSALDTLKANPQSQTPRLQDWQMIGHRLTAGSRPQFILEDLGLCE